MATSSWLPAATPGSRHRLPRRSPSRWRAVVPAANGAPRPPTPRWPSVPAARPPPCPRCLPANVATRIGPAATAATTSRSASAWVNRRNRRNSTPGRRHGRHCCRPRQGAGPTGPRRRCHRRQPGHPTPTGGGRIAARCSCCCDAARAPDGLDREARRWGRPDRDRPRRSCRTPRRHFPAVLRCLSLPAVGAACPGPRCCSAASPRLAA